MKKLILILIILLLMAGSFYTGIKLFTPMCPLCEVCEECEKCPEPEEAAVEEDDEWLRYESEEFGVTFSYPSDFELSEELSMEYESGLKWYRINVTHPTSPEQPNMLLEINPDGYGPFFADKRYQLNETNDGSIEIIEEEVLDNGDLSDDGQVFILTNIKPTNGNNYSWHFTFDEGGQDFEPLFQEILESFEFI